MPPKPSIKNTSPTKTQHVVETIKDGILSGRLSPGQRLPTRDQLRKRFKVGTLTLYNAFDQLSSEGFTYSNRRGGTYVNEYPPHLYHYGVAWEKGMPAMGREALVEAIGALSGQRPHARFETFEIDVDTLDEGYRGLASAIRNRRLAGLVCTGRVPQAFRRHLEKHPQLPVVGLDASAPHPPLVTVHRDKRLFVDMALHELASRGVKRVGCVLSSWTGVLYPDFEKAVIDLGMTTRRHWMFYQSQTREDGPRNCIGAMMNPQLPERPDGLIVGFYEFMPMVNLGLADVELTPEDDLVIVCHSTLPSPVESPFPLVRMAFDDNEAIRLAVECVDRLRRGESLPERIGYAPIIDLKILSSCRA